MLRLELSVFNLYTVFEVCNFIYSEGIKVT